MKRKISIAAIAVAAVILIFIPNPFATFSGETKGGSAEAGILLLQSLATEYKADNGEFPPTDSKKFAEALGGKNKLKKEYLYLEDMPHDQDGRILDPWGEPFQIEISGDTLRVHSPTADRHSSPK